MNPDKASVEYAACALWAVYHRLQFKSVSRQRFAVYEDTWERLALCALVGNRAIVKSGGRVDDLSLPRFVRSRKGWQTKLDPLRDQAEKFVDENIVDIQLLAERLASGEEFSFQQTKDFAENRYAERRRQEKLSIFRRLCRESRKPSVEEN